MSKRKKDPSKVGLSSPEVQGQGTTNQEIDGKSVSSARKSTKKP
ncbi:YuzL family protein [Bacillaceae bacterium CLA-AA-H227]|uniref:YuzL family protein n=2 Tax=Robertmurraya TaxID=2837507 RepID=A0A4U1DBC7_9BACI|nr:YuzL family protein [Robertmurraya kyonggiensis]TKC19353.1 YuzL family protein [Robertmurraya kyonggiensis]